MFKNYDVVFLLETHVMELNMNKYNTYFPNFELHWVEATKTMRFGRACGGILIAIKKNTDAFTFLNVETLFDIKLIKFRKISKNSI